MAQPFTCLCRTPSCRGTIAGARDMPARQLEGLWINAHIRELIERRDAAPNGANGANGTNGTNGVSANGVNGKAADETADALESAVQHADEAAASARAALRSYLGATPNGAGANGEMKAGVKRRGVTSRELAGEMGGDTN